MAKVTFQYRSKNETGNLTIRLTNGTSQKGIDIKTSTPIKSKREYWFSTSNKSKNLLTSITNNSNAINHKRKLEDLKNRIEDLFIIDYNNGIAITKDWLKNSTTKLWETHIKDSKEKINDEIKKIDFIEQSNLLTNAIKSIFIKYKTNKNELKKYKSTLEVIKKYQSHTDRTYKTKDVNNLFADEFKNWCLIDMEYKKSYINALLKRVRASINYAYSNDEDEIIKISKQLNTFSFFKDVYKDKIVVTLNYNEIDKVENTLFTDTELIEAKKILLFGCETGLRFSDLHKLIDTNIKNIGGVNYWTFRTSKTSARVKITVSNRLLHLINKYGLPNPKITYTDTKLNKLLKRVCYKAEIRELTQGVKMKVIKIDNKKVKRNITGDYPKNQLITTRTLRRSFATNYYGKIDTQLILDVTGHKTEKMLRAYINASDNSNVIKSKTQIDNFHKERIKAKNNNPLSIVSKIS